MLPFKRNQAARHDDPAEVGCQILHQNVILTYFDFSGIEFKVNSLLLSMLSPVFRKMLCGEFEESISKTIKLDNVKPIQFKSLIYLACGSDEEKAEGMEELFMLGDLANRYEMKDALNVVEDMLLLELTTESCSDMLQCSAVSGLERVREQCRTMLIDDFQKVSETEGFLGLSEETLSDILDNDDLGVLREEETYKAIMRWIMANGREQLQGQALLTKVRYGLMDNNYLECMAIMAMPAHGALKDLVEEALTRKGIRRRDAVWNGVNRLCDKWMAARKAFAPVLKLAAGATLGNFVLSEPCGVALDLEGHIWVCDADLHQIVMFNSDGVVSQCFGSEGKAVGQFDRPNSVAVDRQGRIVVADNGNDRIQVLNPDGSVVCCFGSKGTALGQLDSPCGVAVDREGRFVVADTNNHRIQVFNIDGSVEHHFGSKGSGVGQLDSPLDVALDAMGRIVVVDRNNKRVQVFDGDGSVALCFGSGGDELGKLRDPVAVTVDREGRFFVADVGNCGNCSIQIFNQHGGFARVFWEGVDQLKSPYGLAVDGAGLVLVADMGEGDGDHSDRVHVF